MMEYPPSELIGYSPPIVALRDQIERLLSGRSATHRLPSVLLRGETGTGKGLVARLLHRRGPRAHGPFVDINCAAIPDTLLEAELFGFERGAFTDARQAKAGLFQTAHGGTIFLDEIGLLPESVQGKLLKVIEERSVRRLGGTRVEAVDVWIIAATSGATAAANLREDLYHRLAVVTLSLPPLRERGDDIVRLADRFLAAACTDYGLPPKTLADDARYALLDHRWPGNVRELMNVMERVALLTTETTVTAAHLALPVSPGARAEPSRPALRPARSDDAAEPTAERLLQVLRETRWNVLRTAATLGTTRSTVRYRIRKFGLRPDTAAPLAPPAGPPSAPPAPARFSWDRRHLTLLRAALDVEALENPMAALPVLQELVDKVSGFGGRIEDLGARGFIAAFGFEPAEDAPWRAAHAAMAIRKVLERRAATPSAPLPLRLVLHGADVQTVWLGAAVTIDLDDRRRIWDALDRLAVDADPDTIRASTALAPFLERRFRLMPAGSGTYHVAGHDGGGFAVGGHVTRYVGRRQERDILRSRLALARSGRGQVVAIAGDAGIGKSRLLFEFRGELGGEALRCLEGRCLSYASDTAYLPVLDLLRGLGGITEADSPGAIADKLGRELDALGMPPFESLPFLLNALSLRDTKDALAGLGPEAVKIRTFEALADLLMRAARARPTVLIVEDLHWIDAISEEFLASLVEAVPAAPLLLLVTYRPGYRPRWITSPAVSQIALAPLSPDESLQVAGAVLQRPTVPDALARLVLAKADGNPFYIEELTRAVAADAEHATRDVIPDTVQGVVRSRIDRLPPRDRRVLHTAAAIGKYFPAALLGAIAEIGAPELRASLGHLQEREFVYATSLGPDARYAFKHPLTYDVAYAGLRLDERRELHGRIVEALEGQYGDRREEHVEALALHAVRAEAWDKAVRYLHRAGERAFQRSANQEAVALLEQAIDAAQRLGDGRDVLERAIDLRFLLQLALFTLGEHGRIREIMREAEALAERAGDRRHQARAANALATNYYVTGDHAEGLRTARRGLALAEAVGDPGMRFALRLRLGFAHHARAELDEGIAALRRALEILKTDGAAYEYQTMNAIPSVHAQTWLVWCLADRGDLAEARQCAREARATADARGHPYSQVMASWGLGYAHLASGRPAEATGAFEESLALCRASTNVHWFPRVAAGSGYAQVLCGRVDEGLALLEQGTAEADRIGLRACSPLLITWLGEAYLRTGRRDDAGRAAQRALERARQQGEQGYEAYALRLLAEIEGSERRTREAADRAQALGLRPLLDRCLATMRRDPP